MPTDLESPTEDEVEQELRELAESVSRDGADAVWRAFADKLHGPAEKAIQLVTLRYLRGYAARIAKRLPAALGQKAVGSDEIVVRAPEDERWLERILATATEAASMEEALRPAIEDAWQRAADAAIADAPESLTGGFLFDHDAVNVKVDEQLGNMIGIKADGSISTTHGVSATTREKVRLSILEGLEAGATIAEMQTALMENSAFNASRALMIARTEATQAVNAAGVNAWEQMADEADMTVDFTWKAQPGARDAHKALNGVVRGEDGHWESGTAKAKWPGGFGVGSLDINCRCTYLPKVTL